MIKSNCDSLDCKIHPTQIVIVETVCDDYIIGGDLTTEEIDLHHNEEDENNNQIKYVISDVADVEFSIAEER